MTLVPAAPGKKPAAIQGGWGMGIPKNVDPAKKAAAWLALTWITNKAINNFSVEKYQIDANRTSAFVDPDAGGEVPVPARSRARRRVGAHHPDVAPWRVLPA